MTTPDKVDRRPTLLDLKPNEIIYSAAPLTDPLMADRVVPVMLLHQATVDQIGKTLEEMGYEGVRIVRKAYTSEGTIMNFYGTVIYQKAPESTQSV